ncbi:MAG: DUF3048 domain-containing protein [Patescibacteria group bacterium]|nr:DUF3048 domain-containing protein [Patescibacteria group bacterium]
MSTRVKSALVVLLVAAGFFAVWFLRSRFVKLASLPQSTPALTQAPPAADSIDGQTVAPDLANRRPIAVMVENFPAARPQAGLADADLVYEAPTEGGITRFMALYQSRPANDIGPVRSARTYFAALADEWGAVYAHVGGNSDALANIKAGDYSRLADADQFFNDPYFSRVASRPMPHNVYTSTERLEKLMSARRYTAAAAYSPWLFKNDAAAASSSAADIQINFSTFEYQVEWKYVFADNSYSRFLAGAAHKDADSGKGITAKNVVVQFVRTYPVQSDTPLSIGMDLTSGGEAEVFLDGQVIVGTWKKQNGRTRYYNQAGLEINFNRGPIWVELVPENNIVRWR